MEHKSAPDHFVTRQILRYLALLWQRAEVENGKLPPVIPVVLYHGQQRWNVPDNFGALFEMPPALDEVVRPYLPEFRYYLCDLSRYNDEELPGGAELQAKLSLLKHIFADDFLAQLPRALQMLLTHLPLEEAGEDVETALRYAQHAGRADEGELLAALETAVAGVGDVKMETIVDKWRNEGISIGEQMGLQKGELNATANLTLLLLKRKFGTINHNLTQQIRALSVPQLQELGMDLLDFGTLQDLTAWLKQHPAAGAKKHRKN